MRWKMTTLNDSQLEAFEKVKLLLSEHFDCWTLAIEVEERDEEDEECTFWRGAFDGGKNRAKGLTLGHLDDLREIKAQQAAV
jgi:hypothetical protein